MKVKELRIYNDELELIIKNLTQKQKGDLLDMIVSHSKGEDIESEDLVLYRQFEWAKFYLERETNI